ncbi:MAG: zinc ribbon domain-containing protein [Oscillospiraceae bacterium]|nr:zinc ribbon domain-containing protein [Oscillospiraceae bacterium]
MSSFDNIVSGAKTAAEAVGKKATTLVDISRMKISAADIRNEINKRYESLGRAVYNSRKDGQDFESLAAECEESIDALYDRLERVNQKIDELSDKNVCDSCGSRVAKDALFCPKCGTELNA